MGLIIKNGVIYNGAESEPVVYSLDEREIGVWIDGKPVYMRVVDLGSDIQISYNSWTLTSVSLDGISRLISVSGLLASGNAYYGDLMAGNNNNKLQLQTPRNTSYVEVRYLIMKYTKTADTAGSGTWTPSGVKAEHYSTTEQVVGTWIDGSTLYEKVFTSTTAANFSTAAIIADVGDNNVIRLFDGLINGQRELNSNLDNSNNKAYTWVTADLHRIANYALGDHASKPCYIVVRYTKSSS